MFSVYFIGSQKIWVKMENKWCWEIDNFFYPITVQINQLKMHKIDSYAILK